MYILKVLHSTAVSQSGHFLGLSNNTANPGELFNQI